jgi:hypothetical protein
MLDIAEISAAPHFPQAMQTVVAGGRQNALSELLLALSGMHEIAVRELNGELHISCAANSGE